MSSAASPGRLTSKTDTVLIFDLDGTILSVNSFRHFVHYLLLGHFKGLSRRKRLVLSLHAGSLLAQRKLLKREHVYVKRGLQRLWTQALAQDSASYALASLNKRLLREVRPNMRGVIAYAANQGIDMLLATAAAGEYAHALGEALGFQHILTTPLCGEQGMENVGDRKRDNVRAYLQAKGWQDRQRIFFTDHEEDLPLIQESHRVGWLGPDAGIEAIRLRAPGIALIPCRGLTDDEVLAQVIGSAD